MDNEKLDFEPGFVPPKNLQYFLLILEKLKKIEGKIKLLKIHFLIEKEGHVKFDMPIDTFQYGPADFDSFNFCEENGLLESAFHEPIGIKYGYYEMKITNAGKLFFDRFCEPNMDKEERGKALKIIEKYSKFNGMMILAHVHKSYVDSFIDKKIVSEFIANCESKLDVFINLSQKQLDNMEVDRSEQFILIGELYHIKEIIKSLRNEDDPTKIGTLLLSTIEFLQGLSENGYRVDPLLVELFEFIDNYAEKEHIHKSIASNDFSDIPESDRKCLMEALAQIEIPLCS